MRGDWRTSRSTFPGPTEGSWSASPTRITGLGAGIAGEGFVEKRQIEPWRPSSTMIASARRSGWPRRKAVHVSPEYSSSRWMVRPPSRSPPGGASLPSRVGATGPKRHFALVLLDNGLQVVVFQVPGPPVSTITHQPGAVARATTGAARPIAHLSQNRAPHAPALRQRRHRRKDRGLALRQQPPAWRRSAADFGSMQKRRVNGAFLDHHLTAPGKVAERAFAASGGISGLPTADEHFFGKVDVALRPGLVQEVGQGLGGSLGRRRDRSPSPWRCGLRS